MKRGFALLIALVFFVLIGMLTTLLASYTSTAGAQARAELELLAARRAAEAGIRIAIERLGQDAAQSYFSDPVAAQYWFGGDLPEVPFASWTADGVLASDGEVFGIDAGMDGLPNILEPGFAVQGDLLAPNYDPNGDDVNPFISGGPSAAGQLVTEGNKRFDGPIFVAPGPGGRAQLIGKPVGAATVQVLAGLGPMTDAAVGGDGVASNYEETQLYDPVASPATGFRPVPYHPMRNPDPAGDDFHPIFNPGGSEGAMRPVAGVFPLPSIENAETRWRRHIYRVGPLAEFEEGKFEGYCAVRAIDTSSKIDLNGPDLLTARLIHGLAVMTAVSPGPVTVSNPALGMNGRGFETFRQVFTNVGPLGGGIYLSLLDQLPQFLLYNNPSYLTLFTGFPVGSQTAPQKIASSKSEEELYFSQPVSTLDGDAIAIVKYRNQVLGGRFTSVTQLLDVRRADGSAIFDERSRDELLRFSQYLTVESWRDPGTISHRNGEALMVQVDPDGIPGTGDERLDWDPSAAIYYEPEPWQDLIQDGVFQGGERFDDFGFDGFASNDSGLGEPSMQDDDDPSDGVSGYVPFANPDPGLDDFHTIWNPFFYRRNDPLYFSALKRRFSVETSRYGTLAWSPLSSGNYYSAMYGFSSLGHYHYSCFFSSAGAFDPSPCGFPVLAKIHSYELTPPVSPACNPLLYNPETWFNFDALEGNGIFDVDPYMGAPNLAGGPPNFLPLATTMWSETWIPNIYDSGLDQLASTGAVLDEFVFSWPSPKNPDPNLDDIPGTVPGFGLLALAGFDSISVGTFGGGATLWGMRNPSGSERNNRLDFYPEWGRTDMGGGGPTGTINQSDIPNSGIGGWSYFNGQAYTFAGMGFTTFLTPRFDFIPGPLIALPVGYPYNELEPPDWIKPDQDWYAEPGERFYDHGRDRIPMTFDFGEGNGMWDPGELFLDLGNDGTSDFDEMAFNSGAPGFGPTGLSGPQVNPWQNSVILGTPPATPGDYHSDNFASVSGRARGSELDQRFNLMREPYLDLNRNGRWDRGGTLQNLPIVGGNDYSVFVDPDAPASFNRNTTGAFRDRNGDRSYDRGFVREPRAPVNVNAAPEEVLATVLYQGLVFPCKKKQDRFLLTNLDAPSLPTLNDSRYDDYDWYTVVTTPSPAPAGSTLGPDLGFAYSVARGVARAIVLRRLGLYVDVGGAPIPGIGNGPFRSWQEFEQFVTTLISTPAETARFASTSGATLVPNAVIPGIPPAFISAAIASDPFTTVNATNFPDLIAGHTSPYTTPPPGMTPVQKLVIDRILVQANPNSRLLGPENYPYQNQAYIDKGDFPFPTTEFCFGPTGYYEINAVGYAVSGEAVVNPDVRKNEFQVTAIVVGAGYALASGDLLSSFDVRSQIEVQRTQKVFDHVKVSTRSDFDGTSPTRHGVSLFPKIEDPKGVGPQTQIAIERLTPITDGQRGSNPSMQSAFGAFLVVRPEVTTLDAKRNLLFTASTTPFDAGYPLPTPTWGLAPPAVWDPLYPGVLPAVNPQGPGGMVQLFDLLSVSSSQIPGGVRNAVTNNGQFIELNYVNANSAQVFYRFGALVPGNGIVPAGAGIVANNPTIAALAFDPQFPQPAVFPNFQHFGGAWAPAAGFVPPSEINYMGRLYMLDNANSLVRAFDIGRDATGGAISQEVQFCTGCNLGYPGLRGVSIQVVPQKREVYVLLVDPVGQHFLQRLRYADGVQYPLTENPGNLPVCSWTQNGGVLDQLPIPVIQPNDGLGRALYTTMVVDSRTGYLYIGGSGVTDINGLNLQDLRVYRCRGGDTLTIDRVFPMTAANDSLEPTDGAFFSVPGYERVRAFPSAGESGGGGIRELVGLDIDPGSNLLLVLWNSQGPTGMIGVGNQYLNATENPNGNGAYLAAVPIGAAPYLTASFVNPFPMDSTPASSAYMPYPTHAACFAVDPVSKTILIAPREQRCYVSGTGSPAPAWAPGSTLNPGAAARGQLALVTYPGDGLRTTDPLFSPTLWTDYREFSGGGPNDPERPKAISLLAFPGKNLFFMPTPANSVTQPTEPILDGVNCLDQFPPGNYVLTQNTRSIQMFRVRGYEFTAANAPRDQWLDGKITPSPNAVPFSAYLNTQDPWIHSRASFEKSPFFMKPDYKLSTVDPTVPVAFRTIPTQVNARVEGEGLVVDSSVPILSKLDSSGAIVRDQRVLFPQDGVGKHYPLSGAPPALPLNPESGWRILNGAGEFWIRFGNLQSFVPTAGRDLVLYEHFQKSKAELFTEPVAALPVSDGANPFLSLSSLGSFLGASIASLGFPGVAPGAGADANYYFPNAIDVWAYDKISLRNIVPTATPGQFQGRVVFQRRLAGPAGQYPGIFRPSVAGGKGPWGIMPASLGALNPQDQFLHPFNVPGGAGDLSDPIERTKYVTVSLQSGGGVYRFAPIWSGGGEGTAAASIESTVEAMTIVPVTIDSNGWMRIVYGSSVRVNGNMITPSRNGQETRVLVWTNLDNNVTISPIGAAVLPAIDPGARNGWFQFPADSEGFLAFGAYLTDPDGVDEATLAAGTPVLGGRIEPGFSYTVDDIVLYESSLPVFLFGPPFNLPFVRTTSRFGIGEGGWPVNTGGAFGTFPGGNIASSSFFPAEPFLDFNLDGTRNWPGNPLAPLVNTVSIWDTNANLRWDFGEMLAFPSDAGGGFPAGVLPLAGQFDQPGIAGIGVGIFGEPFTDFDNNGIWTPSGDLFIDLNSNGVLDGEPFLDNNGNRVFDTGDGFDPSNDINGNGVCDGGEPYIETNLAAGYQPRDGEPYVNVDTATGLLPPQFDLVPFPESFFDENRNGFRDVGEPFVSWSRIPGPPLGTGPQGGELFRENSAGPGAFTMDNFINIAAAAPGAASSGFPHAQDPANVWGAVGPGQIDWNNDGRYESGCEFEGVLLGSVPAGSRLGSIFFTQWRPQIAVGFPDLVGRVAIDLELRARDGRILGTWTGVDMAELVGGAAGSVFADESGIGLPLPVETTIRYRVRFLLPNPRMDQNQVTNNTSPPILDDLALTVTLPQINQVIVENRILTPILSGSFQRGRIAQ